MNPFLFSSNWSTYCFDLYFIFIQFLLYLCKHWCFSITFLSILMGYSKLANIFLAACFQSKVFLTNTVTAFSSQLHWFSKFPHPLWVYKSFEDNNRWLWIRARKNSVKVGVLSLWHRSFKSYLWRPLGIFWKFLR